MELFDALGFHWDRMVMPTLVPIHPKQRVCSRFQRILPVFVWDASVLEDNPITFPEIQALLAGVVLRSRQSSDQEQVLNLVLSTKHLLSLINGEQFEFTKTTFVELHNLVACHEALEWGVFRGEGQETNYTPNVGLGELGRYTPLPTATQAPELNRVFEEGLVVLEICPPFEKSLAFFLFGALQPFFFDGNKRTSRFMMNGILMSNGIDAINIPANKAHVFNEKMVRFYLTKNATEMMIFLVDCHPNAAQTYAHNSNLKFATQLDHHQTES